MQKRTPHKYQAGEAVIIIVKPPYKKGVLRDPDLRYDGTVQKVLTTSIIVTKNLTGEQLVFNKKGVTRSKRGYLYPKPPVAQPAEETPTKAQPKKAKKRPGYKKRAAAKTVTIPALSRGPLSNGEQVAILDGFIESLDQMRGFLVRLKRNFP